MKIYKIVTMKDHFFHGESQKITLELKKNIAKKETAFFYFILHTLKRSATASAEINREIG
jgi:hypothetical protein